MGKKEKIINEIMNLYIKAAIIVLSLYSQQISAFNSSKKCVKDILTSNSILENHTTHDTNNLIISINSDYAKGNYPNNVLFSGNVEVRNKNSRLNADKIQIYKQRSKDKLDPVFLAKALGNVYYENEQLFIKGKKGLANLHTQDIDIWEGGYQILGYQGRGNAYRMRKYGGNRYLMLEHGSFTSCVPGVNIWSIVGSKVIHDREKKTAKIWHARFKIGSVPVFYSPYLQIAVGDRRHSGFLIPSTRYTTTNGFEFRLPYYLNIIPSMDVTVTPCYICKYRNILWENEFRYLTNLGSGLIEIDYLPSKKKVFKNKKEKENKKNQWLFYWRNSLVLDQILDLNIDYTKVNDPFYFRKFNSRYGSSADNYTTQKLTATFTGSKYESAISIKQFQILNHFLKKSNYKTKPRLDISWHQKKIGPFDFIFYGQKLSLVNSEFNTSKLTRVHFEPAIIFPLENNFGSFNTEAKLMVTRYHKTGISWNDKICNIEKNLKSSFSRVLPQLKIDGKFLFERKINKNGRYVQILEPRIQYLYVPYCDQKKIKNYDSSFLQVEDYDGLFRDRIYGGIDRISSVNQLKTGIQTYIYDDSSIERFKIAVAQSYEFTASCAGDNLIQKDKKESGSLFWIGDFYWKITDQWSLQNTIQYNRYLNNLAVHNSILEYLYGEERMIRLTYRYANPKYVQDICKRNNSNKQCKKGISRVGGEVNWPLSNQWSVIGSYYFDANIKKPSNRMVFLQHSSCCCVIRLGYENKINHEDIRGNFPKYNSVIGFNIELRGLTSKS